LINRRFSVPHGTSRIASPPAELRATVGPGYAVAIVLPNGSGGGIVHMKVRTPYPEIPSIESRDEEAIAGSLNRFLSELKQLSGNIEGANAEVVGGADVLRIVPQHIREHSAYRNAGFITEVLADNGISVSRSAVGGTNGRTVLLSLANGKRVGRVLNVHRTGINPSTRSSLPRTTLSIPPEELLSGRKVHNVDAGALVIDCSPAQCVAVLGSCVGVALWDPISKIGGMVHVMIPQSNPQCENPARYGDTAIPYLAEELQKAGAKGNRLKAHVGGGANVLLIGRMAHSFRIGERNIENVKNSLKQLRIPIVVEDVGGFVGRKMWVNFRNFACKIKALPSGNSHRKESSQ